MPLKRHKAGDTARKTDGRHGETRGERTPETPGKPALAIYCRCPVAGKVKTRLAEDIGEENALRFYEGCIALLQEELGAVRKSYDIVICPANRSDRQWAAEAFPLATHILPQEGENLGGRLTATQSDLAALGYEQIAFIGSDAPSLPFEFLIDMNKMLGLFDVVLGPAKDGGVWGIGANEPLPGLLRISWSTPNVYNELTEACHRGDLTVGVLPGWYDVDRIDSLQLAADDLIRSTSRKRQDFGTWIE